MGEVLGCGERGLSKGEVWVLSRVNAQDLQGWKRSWGLWGLGLRLKEQKGPRHAQGTEGAQACSKGRGPHLGAQQASWAQVGGVNTLLSSPAPPVWGLGGPLLPASPDLPGLPSMPPGPMLLGGGSLGGEGAGLGT